VEVLEVQLVLLQCHQLVLELQRLVQEKREQEQEQF
jgi:hypothetical protein